MELISLLSTTGFSPYLILGQGLTKLTTTALDNWIQPLYLVGIAVMSIIFIKDRAWMKLIGFLGIAAIVGMVVFAGEALFGSGEGGLTGVAKDGAEMINTVESSSIVANATNSVISIK